MKTSTICMFYFIITNNIIYIIYIISLHTNYIEKINEYKLNDKFLIGELNKHISYKDKINFLNMLNKFENINNDNFILTKRQKKLINNNIYGKKLCELFIILLNKCIENSFNNNTKHIYIDYKENYHIYGC